MGDPLSLSIDSKSSSTVILLLSPLSLNKYSVKNSVLNSYLSNNVVVSNGGVDILNGINSFI